MQDIPSRPATYEDLIAAPDHLVAEIIRGQLVTHPRPAPRQSTSASRLGVILGRSFDWDLGGVPGGWWIVFEPELHLKDGDILVPDIAAWQRERMPELPQTAWFEVVPDWVCEVLSPSTSRRDKGPKREIYAANGVHYLWHVDTSERILECFELVEGRWVLLKTFVDEDTVVAPPFEAVPFGLRPLWPK